MRRREFIAALGASVTWPFAARAQEAMPTVGVLNPALSSTTIVGTVFPEFMKEFGWDENRNYRIVFRYAEGHTDRLPVLMDALLAEKVSVIVVVGEAAIQAAQRPTKTIPTVGMAADMVRTGLAASMAKPGGNLTGVNILSSELDVKRLAILHEAVPAANRIGALALPEREFDTVPELEKAARKLDVELVVISVRRVDELAAGFDALQSARVDAVNVLASPLANAARASIIEGLNRARLPAIYEFPEIAEQGGFLGYGPRLELGVRLISRLVSKILRGARPEDLPIEQPDRFELVVNLKTADALSVKVPPTLLVQADKVIE
ncbi:MAG TPA: ABC transporter substrate-binding protein [Xanthobacteraceae bacterium]|nr:ABC transporter substrate-binding protein [Xanthobacteraceae bacterium]